MAMEMSKRLHVVLLSFDAKGHMNPFMELAKKLAALGLSVTVVIPNKLAVSQAARGDEGWGIDLVALPVDGDDGGGNRSRVPMKGIRRLPGGSPHFPSLQKPLRVLLEQMMESSSPPVAVVVDVVLPWACATIDELGIPRYVLYTSTASHLALNLYLHDGEETVDKKVLESEDVVNVPGLPPLRWNEVSNELWEESHPFYLGKKGAREMLLQSKGILMNTSCVLEGKVIAAIHAGHPKARCIPIGPLVQLKNVAGEIRRSTPLLPSTEEERCKSWLKSRCPSSLIFLSFGSWAALSDEQVRELAAGLEASSKPFLWVLPPPNENAQDYLHSVLPEGFQGRTEDRGLIVSAWAPQQLILSHPSVGGFVTHCGWNSVLECILLAGVPMLGWPFLGDQPLICRYIVEKLKIGVNIRENADGLAESGEIERALRALMEDCELRKRAKRMRESIQEATRSDEDGSSQRNLELFAQSLKS